MNFCVPIGILSACSCSFPIVALDLSGDVFDDAWSSWDERIFPFREQNMDSIALIFFHPELITFRAAL